MKVTLCVNAFIFQGPPFANEVDERESFAAMANPSLLDFDERPDLYVIADLAAVQICKRENLDPLAKFHVRCDSLEGWVGCCSRDETGRACRGVHYQRPLPLPE